MRHRSHIIPHFLHPHIWFPYRYHPMYWLIFFAIYFLCIAVKYSVIIIFFSLRYFLRNMPLTFIVLSVFIIWCRIANVF